MSPTDLIIFLSIIFNIIVWGTSHWLYCYTTLNDIHIMRFIRYILVWPIHYILYTLSHYQLVSSWAHTFSVVDYILSTWMCPISMCLFFHVLIKNLGKEWTMTIQTLHSNMLKLKKKYMYHVIRYDRLIISK